MRAESIKNTTVRARIDNNLKNEVAGIPQRTDAVGLHPVVFRCCNTVTYN